MIPSEQEAFPRQRGAPAWLLCLLLFWIPVLCLCCTMGAFGSQLWQSCAASGSEAFPLLSPLPPPASSMRARKGRAIGATSTRRTSAARRRRRPARMAPRRERSRTARSEGPRRDVLLWNRRGGGDVSFWFYFVFSSCFFSQGKRAWLWVSSEAHRSGLSRGCTCS